MKKSLSLILAIAMVFSMFASVAFAGEATVPADAGKYLQELKVIEGGEGGDLMADANWKRQDVTVLLSRLLGVEAAAKATAKSHTFADVSDKFYDGYISWAKANKYFEGKSDTSFGYNDQITNQEFAAVVLRALGVDTTGDNFAKTADLAVAKGIVAAGTDFAANAKRGDTYKAIVAALSVEVGTTGKTLGETLKLPGYVKVALTAEAKVAGVKKVSVTFNNAVDTSKATFELKLNTLNVPVTASWSEDKKVATLTANSNFVVGKYSLKVGGLELATESYDLEVASEKLTTAKLLAGSVKPNTANGDIAVQGYNQYGENLAVVGTDFVWTVYNKTAKLNMTVTGQGTAVVRIDTTTAGVKVGDELLVTGVHKTDASVVVNNAVVISDAAMSELSFGELKLASGDTRLIQKAAATYYELPYTLKDAAGNTVTLDEKSETSLATAVTFNGVVLSTDKAAVLTNVKVESGKLYIKVGANQNGDVKLIATLPAVSKVVTAAFKVNGLSASDNAVLGAQTKTLTAGGTVDIPVTVYDQYGAVIKAEDVVTGNFSIGSSNPSIASAAFTADKKSIRVTGVAKGTATITLTNNNSSKVVTFVADVKDAAVPTTFEYTVDATNLVATAQQTLKAKVYNQYGDAMTSAQVTGYTFAVTLPALNTNLSISDNAPSAATMIDTGVTVTGNTANTSTDVTIKLIKTAGPVDVQTQTVAFKVVATDAALTYSVTSIPVAYAAGAAGATYAVATAADAQNAATGVLGSNYAKDLKVVAKDSSGAIVAIPSSYIKSAVAIGANASALAIKSDYTKAVGLTWADSAATKEVTVAVTIQNPNNTLQVVNGTVTVVKEAPKATAIKIYKNNGTAADLTDDVEITDGKLTLTAAQVDALNNADIGLTTAATTAPAFYFVVVDQYGVKALDPIAFVSSKTGATTFTVATTTGVVTAASTAANDVITIHAIDAQGNSKILVVTATL